MSGPAGLLAVEEPAVADAVVEDPVGGAARGVLVTRLLEHARREGEGGDRQRRPVRQQLVVGGRCDAAGADVVHLPARLREHARDVLLGPAEVRRELREAADDREDRLPVLEVSALGDAEPGRDDGRGVGADRVPRAIPGSRRRTCPLLLPSPRPAPRRIRLPPASSRAAGSRASRARRGRRPGCRTRGTPGRRAGRASRCRRASFRNGGRASARPRSSGGSRRRPGRTCRRPPSSRASSRSWRAPTRRPCAASGAAAARAASRAGTSARCRTRPRRRRTAARAPAPTRRRAPAPEPGRGRRRLRVGVEVRDHLVGRGLELFAPLPPRRADGLEQLRESGLAPARRRRVIRAAVEGLAVRRQEERERPAALARHELDGLHVDVVDVGTLLAVHLDRDEVPFESAAATSSFSKDSCSITWHQWQVEYPIERKIGLFSAPRARECLLAPGIPVDRVVLVLEEVGGRLAGEAVGHRPEDIAEALSP